MRIWQIPQWIINKLAKILNAIDESKSLLSLKAIDAKGIKKNSENLDSKLPLTSVSYPYIIRRKQIKP